MFNVIIGGSMPLFNLQFDWLCAMINYLTSCLEGCGSVLPQSRGPVPIMLEGGKASNYELHKASKLTSFVLLI